MEGENLLQPHDLEDVFHAGTEARERKLSAVTLDRLEILDQGGEAGGIDVVDSAEVEQEQGRFFGRLGLQELPQFGRGFQVDIAGNRDDGNVILGTFGDLHTLELPTL